MGSCCAAPGAQLGALGWPRGVGWGRGWKGGSKREEIYVYRWVTSLHNRNSHNIAKQLYSNLKNNLKIKIEKKRNKSLRAIVTSPVLHQKWVLRLECEVRRPWAPRPRLCTSITTSLGTPRGGKAARAARLCRSSALHSNRRGPVPVSGWVI